MFKSVFDRLIGRLGGGPSHSSLSSDSMDSSELEHELLVVAKASEMQHSSSFQDGFPPPSPPCTPVERMETPEQDEVLFSKNNVFLSYPKRASLKTHDLTRFSSLENSRTPSPQALSSTGDNSNSNSSASSSFQDNQILVPGYLFITTRGSNYGTTLILNWAPNSSMRVPPVSTSLPLHLQPSTSTNSLGSATISTLTNGDQIDTAASSTDNKERGQAMKDRSNGSHVAECTEGDAVDFMTTNSRENPSNSWPIIVTTGRGGDALVPGTARVEKVGAGVGLSRVGVGSEEALLGYDRPSCSSVSIDLGLMEMIRIFYNTDTNGFIVSGEMVIRSKDRNFKVSQPVSIFH